MSTTPAVVQAIADGRLEQFAVQGVSVASLTPAEDDVVTPQIVLALVGVAPTQPVREKHYIGSLTSTLARQIGHAMIEAADEADAEGPAKTDSGLLVADAAGARQAMAQADAVNHLRSG